MCGLVTVRICLSLTFSDNVQKQAERKSAQRKETIVERLFLKLEHPPHLDGADGARWKTQACMTQTP